MDWASPTPEDRERAWDHVVALMTLSLDGVQRAQDAGAASAEEVRRLAEQIPEQADEQVVLNELFAWLQQASPEELAALTSVWSSIVAALVAESWRWKIAVDRLDASDYSLIDHWRRTSSSLRSASRQGRPDAPE